MANQRISNVLTRPPLPEIDLLDLWKSISREVMFNLTAEIPAPKAKVPKPQKSFATLKPDDVLVNLESNIIVTITEVDSLGASGVTTDCAYVLLGREWKDFYKKLKKSDLKKLAKLASIDSVTVR